MGYLFAQDLGRAAHYLLVPARDRADQLARELESDDRLVQVWGGGTAQHWIVQVWTRGPEELAAEIAELARAAARGGGTYDGGEMVAGEVWGPRGP